MATGIAVVTGASGGIGAALSRRLVAKGLSLVMLERDAAKAKGLADELARLRHDAVADIVPVDLSDHLDIRRATSEVLGRHPAVDCLFCNAGVLTESLMMSGHGNELHFEVNTLAPLQILDQLRPALAAAPRGVVVCTSAGIASRVTELDWDELVRPQNFEKLFGPYVRSKQALNVLACALAPELANDGTVIRTADPGPTRTRLTRGAGTPWWMRMFYWALPGPDHAAGRIAEAAFDERWGDRSGISISGAKVQRLPPALADPAWQAAFLARCRERVAEGSGDDRAFPS